MFMESLWTALDNGEISTGGVICDNSGNWMVSYAKKPGFGSILLAELWALFFGPEIVIARNMYSLVVNSVLFAFYQISWQFQVEHTMLPYLKHDVYRGEEYQFVGNLLSRGKGILVQII